MPNSVKFRSNLAWWGKGITSTFCHVTLWHVTSRCLRLRYFTSRMIRLRFMTLRLRYHTLRHVTLFFYTLLVFFHMHEGNMHTLHQHSSKAWKTHTPCPNSLGGSIQLCRSSTRNQNGVGGTWGLVVTEHDVHFIAWSLDAPKDDASARKMIARSGDRSYWAGKM